MDRTDGSVTDQLIHGGDVYRNRVRLDFSVSLDPLDMPAEIKAAMLEGISEAGQYPDPLQQKLRDEIALLEGVSPEEVICGNGASELIMAAVHAVRPEKALVTAPCYAGYAKALEASGAKVTEHALREADGFALGEDFANHITDDTDMVFFADPNNPNGRLTDPAVKDGIIKKCEISQAVAVIDECFYPLAKGRSGSGGLHDTALHLKAFTKTFAIPGVRLGYMISADTGLLAGIKKQLPEWNVSRIAERTGEAAARMLRETDYLERSLKLIETERSYLGDSLSALGMKVYPSDVNYLLVRGRPGLYGELLRRGILVRNCANFSGLDERYFRIAVRKHGDNEELIKNIGEIL